MLTTLFFDRAGWLSVPPVSWVTICKLGNVSVCLLQSFCVSAGVDS